MKKYAFLAILFGALTFISCDSKGGSSSSDDDEKTEKSKDDKDKDDADDSHGDASITGTWKVDKSSVRELMGDDADELTDADMKFKFDDKNMNMIMTACVDKEGVRVAFEVDCKFSYTLVDNVICSVYKSCEVTLTELDLSDEMEEAIAMQGMDEDDMMEIMEEQFVPQMEKEMSSTFGDDFDKMTIKELKGNRMTLVSEDDEVINMKRM